jgi:hypothetical protein
MSDLTECLSSSNFYPYSLPTPTPTPDACSISQELILSVLSVMTVARWMLLNSGCNFKSFCQRIFKQIRDEHYLVGRKLQNRIEIASDSVC